MAKNQTAARSPALPSGKDARRNEKAAKRAPDVEIEDADDDEDDEDERPRKGGPKRSDKAMLIIRIGRLVKGTARVKHSLGKTGEEQMAELDAALKALNTFAGKLPEDWERARIPGGVVTRTFEPGVKVQVREKRIAAYEGLLEKKDLANLTVTKQVGNKLGLKTSSGATVFLPVAHVTVQGTDEDDE